MRHSLSLVTILAITGTAAAQPDPAPTPAPTVPPEPAKQEPPPSEPPMPAPEPKKEDKGKGSAGYDKGFYIKTDDGKFLMLFSGRIQPFYIATYTAEPKNVTNDFEVKRLRFTFEGHLHTKKLAYKVQTDYGKGFLSLKDGHFDFEVAKDAWLRFGQWKKPFSRQQITSSGRLETPDRSITDKAFGAGRDIGVAIGNKYDKSPDGIEWVVGLFNGTGDGAKLEGIVGTIDPDTGEVIIDSSKGKFINVPKEFLPALVARVGYNKGGIKGYNEADLEGGPLRWAAAASVELQGDFDENDKSNQKAEIDYIVKSNGFSTTGGFYLQTDQKADSTTDFELSLVGFHLQGGYMLDKHTQLSARYAFIDDPRTSVAQAANQQEIQLAGNYYMFGHDAKFAGGVKFIKNGDAGFGDNIVVELGANVGW